MMTSRIGDIDEWLTRLQSLVERGHCPSPTFLKPYHFTTLAFQLIRAAKPELRIPYYLEPYAARMNLWEALGHEPPRKIKKGEASGRFLPLQSIRNRGAVSEHARSIKEIARVQFHGDQTLDSLEEVLAEILDNSFAHAQIDPELPSFACAQSWPKGNLAQVAVGDGGIGIRASLTENPELLYKISDGNACAVATERYVTSKPGPHSGYGLSLARDLIEQNRGTIIIVSGNEVFRSAGGKPSVAKLDVPWMGTLVILEWNTDRVLDSQFVYSEWNKAERGTDESP